MRSQTSSAPRKTPARELALLSHLFWNSNTKASPLHPRPSAAVMEDRPPGGSVQQKARSSPLGSRCLWGRTLVAGGLEGTSFLSPPALGAAGLPWTVTASISPLPPSAVAFFLVCLSVSSPFLSFFSFSFYRCTLGIWKFPG